MVVFVRNALKDMVLRSSFNLDDVFLKTQGVVSAKPEEVVLQLDAQVKNFCKETGILHSGNKELFARDNNQRPEWTVYGEQLSEDSRVLGLYLRTRSMPKEFIPRYNNVKRSVT